LTKKDINYSEAERMYVVDQMTLEEIATRTLTNERTIRRWKDTGDWEEKRTNFLSVQQSFHEKLYVFAQKFMKTIEDDIDNGEKIDTGRMYTFSRMLPFIVKMKEYEEVLSKKHSPDTKKGLTPEVIRLIEEEILGIRHDQADDEE